jgi:hypothetical protein
MRADEADRAAPLPHVGFSKCPEPLDHFLNTAVGF